MRGPGIIAIILVAGLAGCADGETSVEDESFQDFEEDLEVTDTTGLILGVVVDETISPIEGATVTLTSQDLSTTTDADGRFAFDDLPGGIYFVDAEKQGFDTAQTSVEVQAGVEKPPVTRLMMIAIPGSEPSVIPLHIEGVMVCSAQVAIAFMTGCMVGAYIDDHSRNYYDVESTPTFLQSELTWVTTQSLAQDACMRNYASTGIGGPSLSGDSCGPSPRVHRTPAERLNETDVGAGRGVENVVWVSPLGAGGVPVLGVAVDQKFDVYVHMFYNAVPDEEWLFITDGAPEI